MSKCNKCKKNQTSCTCDVNYGCDPLDASCVLYNGEDLNCIADIPSGTSVKKILELWNQYFCEFNNISVLQCVKEKLNIDVDVNAVSQTFLLGAIQNWICNLDDINVKASPSDTKSGYLIDKISLGDCLDKALTEDEDGNQTVKISINWGCLNARIPACFDIQTNDCLTVDCATCSGPICTPQPYQPIIARDGFKLTGTNCNGNMQWYNRQNVLVGSGTVYIGEGGQSYYAKCNNNCGESTASATIDIPLTPTFTAKRKAIFNKLCGVNACNVPCIGTSHEFEKTYTSTISQEHANTLAQNDVTFALDGQKFADLSGECICHDCNCVFPTYTEILKTNSTCSGNIVQANGQIIMTGIANADKFGWSLGSGDYSGVGYANAISLNNYSGGNITTSNGNRITINSLSTETRVIIRLFNASGTCYKDFFVTLTPPNCNEEQIVIDDVVILCELEELPCKNWAIVSGSAPSSVFYLPCNSVNHQFATLPAFGTMSVCSAYQPNATGALISSSGTCI